MKITYFKNYMWNNAFNILEIDKLIERRELGPECYNEALRKTFEVMNIKFTQTSFSGVEQILSGNPQEEAVNDGQESGNALDFAFYVFDFLETLAHELVNHLHIGEDGDESIYHLLDRSEGYGVELAALLREGDVSHREGLETALTLFQEQEQLTLPNAQCQCPEY